MNYIVIPCPSLENTSEEIRSNRPCSSFGIWLHHFKFVILMNRKTHFNSLCFYYNIKCKKKYGVIFPQDLVDDILFTFEVYR